MERTCSVCGQEKRLLFTSYACFNERCGQETLGSEDYQNWMRWFGQPRQLELPDDIEVVRCMQYPNENAIDVCYRLKGAEWYGAQFSTPDRLPIFALEARDLWKGLRESRPVNFAKLTKAGSYSWSVP